MRNERRRTGGERRGTRKVWIPGRPKILLVLLLLADAGFTQLPLPARAQPPEPVVAVHVSELTQALEAAPAGPATPSGPGTTGREWWVTSWHYFVIPESLKEVLRSDGTPFIEVSDKDISAGRLLHKDGSPRYPIVISLAAEAAADGEITQLRKYVAAGGMLFMGSSAFTRRPDGAGRGDFALADELGLHTANRTLRNWYENLHFTKVLHHRLVGGIPNGTLAWRLPAGADEIPLGASPRHAVHGRHQVFEVRADAGTTVIAAGDAGPLVATRQYGKGRFVYHGDMQPLVGHTVYDPVLSAYLIYRHAIEWAFENANLALIRLSPWRFEYDAAFTVRHDFEDKPELIRSIEKSAAFEHSVGASGDYYFCTGTLGHEMYDKKSVLAGLRTAVTEYGATIGSHNGGLKNPVNASLSSADFDYQHWGPDETVNAAVPGYPSGKAYARDSLFRSFNDLEGWLAGVDNGRAGCGLTHDCPRIWAAPYFNSTREDSRKILEELRALTAGEQKIGPFPHHTLSYQTPGRRFSSISVPASDWYVGAEIPGALEWGHTPRSMRAAVDFYYALGAPINLYGHIPSDDATLMGKYVKYCAAKSRMWAANAVGISDWWRIRSKVLIRPAFGVSGDLAAAGASISGSMDSGTAIEVILPCASCGALKHVKIFLNETSASQADYRISGNRVKVRVGKSASGVQVQYPLTQPSPGSLTPSDPMHGRNLPPVRHSISGPADPSSIHGIHQPMIGLVVLILAAIMISGLRQGPGREPQQKSKAANRGV